MSDEKKKVSSKKVCLASALLACVLVGSISLGTYFFGQRSVEPIEYEYKSGLYVVRMTSYISFLSFLDDENLVATFGVLQNEVNYYGGWQLEKRTNWNSDSDSMLVQSKLPGIVIVKNFTFLPACICFNLTKTYLENMVTVNDQLMVDLKNVGIVYHEQSFMFLEQNGNITFTILEANPPVTIQEAGQGTEVQLNFNNQCDRTYMYHAAGERQTVSLLIKLLS